MSTVELSDYVNVQGAAEIIGCTVGRVRQLLLADELKGEKVSLRMWLVEKTDAERYRDTEQSGGMPRGTILKRREKRPSKGHKSRKPQRRK